MFKELEEIQSTGSFKFTHKLYSDRLKHLLEEINKCYLQLLKDNTKIPKSENKIRDILVDNYLTKLNNYEFSKEQANNYRSRVDIYVVEKAIKENPNFIIECKLLNKNNNMNVEALNAKYIKNGIQRFITEYYECCNLHTNAMIGFVVEDTNIANNVKDINALSKIFFNNLLTIQQEISKENIHLYKSSYSTYNNKTFTIYHLFLDLHKNIKKNKETVK